MKQYWAFDRNTNTWGLTTGTDIGGVESRVTTEKTALAAFLDYVIDDQFWETDTEISYFVSVLHGLQSAVLAQAELTASDIRRQWYVKESRDLERFASIIEVSRYALNFDEFRRMLVSLWLAYSDWGTLAAISKVAGAYTGQATFFTRVSDHQDYWLLGYSPLGLQLSDPLQAFPPNVVLPVGSIPPSNTYPMRTVLPSYYNWVAGVVAEIHGGNQLLPVRTEEFLRVLDEVSDIAPLSITITSAEEPSSFPSGVIALRDRNHSFANSYTVNAKYDMPSHMFVVTTLAPISTSAEIRTIPVDTTPLCSTIAALATYDYVASERVHRRFFYRQGDTADEADPSYTLFTEIRAFERIPLTHQYLQLKTVVYAKQASDPIVRGIDYGLGGFSLRRPTARTLTFAPCYEDSAVEIITQGYLSRCPASLYLSKITYGFLREFL